MNDKPTFIPEWIDVNVALVDKDGLADEEGCGGIISLPQRWIPKVKMKMNNKDDMLGSISVNKNFAKSIRNLDQNQTIGRKSVFPFTFIIYGLVLVI